MSASPSTRMNTPARPGGFVTHETIELDGLSVTDTARVLGAIRPALTALLMNAPASPRNWRCASKRPWASRWKPLCA